MMRRDEGVPDASRPDGGGTGVRLLFATQVTGNGDLAAWPGAGGKSGLAAADLICQRRAAAAGLPGTFRAWLSDATFDAHCRVNGLAGKRAQNCGQAQFPNNAGPFTRTGGAPFSESIATLTRGIGAPIHAPVRFDEFGALITVSPNYFTSTLEDGTFNLFNGDCQGWTSGAANLNAGVGFTDDTIENWTAGGAHSSFVARLLCMQITLGGSLAPFQQVGPRAFVSSQSGTADLATWPQSGGQSGLGAGDAICRALAIKGHLANPTHFKAWLSAGRTWVRIDGILVAHDKTELTVGRPYAPLDVTEAGDYLPPELAWTGTASVGVATGADCSGWTSGASQQSATVGDSAIGDSGSTALPTTQACNSPNGHLFCFED